jgi:hypothetical protein
MKAILPFSIPPVDVPFVGLQSAELVSMEIKP